MVLYTELVRACATGRRRCRSSRPSVFRSVTINRWRRGWWGQKRETTVCVGETYRERVGGRRSKLILYMYTPCVCAVVDRRDSWENNIMANQAARVKKGCVRVVFGILYLFLVSYTLIHCTIYTVTKVLVILKKKTVT